MKFIKEFLEGDRVSGQFLVNNVTKGVNNLGAAYLSCELRDCSGTLTAKKWEIVNDDEQTFVIGNVIEATIEIIKYRESLQGKIISASLVNPDDVDIFRFVQQPPIKKEVLEEKFNNYVASIKNEEYKKVINYFLNKYKDKIFIYPAASSIHHEYSSGLLMHTVSMCDLGVFIADKYPNVNKDLLLTGIILHDLGKLTELEGPAVYRYSLEGKLIGHISIMSAEVKNACEELAISKENAILLQHMILSHHGEHDYGSPVLPLTLEAMILHLIDNVDSKITILNKALDEINEGEFTQKIFPLDGRQFYKHK